MMTVTVHRGVRGPNGDVTWSPSHTISGCKLAPMHTSEETERGETVVVGLQLLPPFGADIKATDRVEVPAGPWQGMYDVDGDPGAGHWKSAWSDWAPGAEVALVRHV